MQHFRLPLLDFFFKKSNQINLSKNIIEKGILNTKWHGRLEKINCENNLSELWIDSCHNPQEQKLLLMK